MEPRSLVPATRTSLVAPGNRQISRAIAQIEARTSLELADVWSNAQIQAGTAAAVGYVGRCAMHEVAMVTQLEQQLATVVPLAASRLQAIGDVTALELTEVVAEARRRMR